MVQPKTYNTRTGYNRQRESVFIFMNVLQLVIIAWLLLFRVENDSTAFPLFDSEFDRKGKEQFVDKTFAEKKRLLTAGEMKSLMRLPCNYAHDGFYYRESNEVLNQVYLSLMELEDDDIPVVVECGGHDGITKSLSLKSSVCLHMNTLLIEGSPANYNILKKAREYDYTVQAALCSGDTVEMAVSKTNSGEAHVLSSREGPKETMKVNCTSIDNELDNVKATLPPDQQDKLKFLFLVLDVEGHEGTAIDGIKKYSPKKAFMELGKIREDEKAKLDDWIKYHHLKDTRHNVQDTWFNAESFLTARKKDDGWQMPSHARTVFYAARKKPPAHHVYTGLVSPAYLFYGE